MAILDSDLRQFREFDMPPSTQRQQLLTNYLTITNKQAKIDEAQKQHHGFRSPYPPMLQTIVCAWCTHTTRNCLIAKLTATTNTCESLGSTV